MRENAQFTSDDWQLSPQVQGGASHYPDHADADADYSRARGANIGRLMSGIMTLAGQNRHSVPDYELLDHIVPQCAADFAPDRFHTNYDKLLTARSASEAVFSPMHQLLDQEEARRSAAQDPRGAPHYGPSYAQIINSRTHPTMEGLTPYQEGFTNAVYNQDPQPAHRVLREALAYARGDTLRHLDSDPDAQFNSLKEKDHAARESVINREGQARLGSVLGALEIRTPGHWTNLGRQAMSNDILEVHMDAMTSAATAGDQTRFYQAAKELEREDLDLAQAIQQNAGFVDTRRLAQDYTPPGMYSVQGMRPDSRDFIPVHERFTEDVLIALDDLANDPNSIQPAHRKAIRQMAAGHHELLTFIKNVEAEPHIARDTTQERTQLIHYAFAIKRLAHSKTDNRS